MKICLTYLALLALFIVAMSLMLFCAALCLIRLPRWRWLPRSLFYEPPYPDHR